MEEKVWLVKVPEFLDEQWRKRKADSDSFAPVKLGKITVKGDLSAGGFMVQCDGMPEEIPSDYKMQKTGVAQPPNRSRRTGMQVVSDHSQAGEPKVDGTVVTSYELKTTGK
eukprot:SAG22_NODE_6496_length_847_cov_0.741979_2_plen_110_part_01